MLFAGLQKLTLLDYPQHTACTLFTQGCNLRCPFCHNSSLLDACRAPENPILAEDVLAFLYKRRGTLDGVCITGGEPLMHDELRDFILHVRAMGFLVKLDTNGTYPDKLRHLIDEGLLDMVAMDIKNAPDRYAMTVGIPHFDLSPVRESAALLKENKISFEFRTTVADELHRDEDMEETGKWLQGAEKYFLQPYVESDAVLHKGLTPPSQEKLQRFIGILRPYLPLASIRGI
ncbi:MAG: anaerobic ribonucleoside-triphosphate reductase activating protein [Clostridia bacterium]|nr:anaerobic ribonucleoside-triphosphate reductase activating protein [Clostridia bacterium]